MLEWHRVPGVSDDEVRWAVGEEELHGERHELGAPRIGIGCLRGSTHF